MLTHTHECVCHLLNFPEKFSEFFQLLIEIYGHKLTILDIKKIISYLEVLVTAWSWPLRGPQKFLNIWMESYNYRIPSG